MPFERAHVWDHDGFDERAARDEERVRRDFWRKASAGRGKAAVRRGSARRLLLRLRPRRRPCQVKAALVGALAYFVLPFDFVPDMLPLLGFTDDAAVLLTALRMVAGHLRPEHRDAARARSNGCKAGRE